MEPCRKLERKCSGTPCIFTRRPSVIERLIKVTLAERAPGRNDEPCSHHLGCRSTWTLKWPSLHGTTQRVMDDLSPVTRLSVISRSYTSATLRFRYEAHALLECTFGTPRARRSSAAQRGMLATEFLDIPRQGSGELTLRVIRMAWQRNVAPSFNSHERHS